MSLATRIHAGVEAAAPRVTGRVSRVVGLELEIAGLDAAIGDVVTVDGSEALAAEVVALRDGRLVCLPYGELQGVRAGAPAAVVGGGGRALVGRGLLGRVVDAFGRPLDGGPPISDVVDVPLDVPAPNPLSRSRVDRQLSLGVRALDTLVPCGRGQRIGVFAGSGVGKSSLLSMIARGTDAEVSVIALVGERGREVREFVENDLGPEGLARSVVVVSTSDEPALRRRRAAFFATRVAEWFRDGGSDVVLMMDSLTRFCMAQREIGLSAGEPPATRGYPPSVFALLPRLLERAGPGTTGSITALYTVLVEGDDMNEPVGDAARSILDGHVVLTRALATAGHFPSIDVLESVSRVAPAITSAEQQSAATELRRLLAAHRDAKDLIEIGAYASGTNPTVDRAIALRDDVDGFLRQSMHESPAAAASWSRLQELVVA